MARKTRPGRQPGEWKLVKPEDLRTWRASSSVSRAKVAVMLGVSPTSVQNWETGLAVATQKTQRRLAELMSSPGISLMMASTSVGSTTASDEASLHATGVIVAAYARTNAKLSPGDLTTLIRGVRQALGG